jgi:UDP-N-acetylmuramoyl-tripeptide--D-alanyl-D-alanine ligase
LAPWFSAYVMTIEQLYSIFRKFPIVCTDSRLVKMDSLFFALKGEFSDGNLFAAKALENGASFAIVDNPEVAVDDRFIVVDDVLSSLQKLAAFHRRKLKMPVIAITGTNGKTTTKELTAAVLGTQKNIEYTRGNLNNHIGVPLTLLTITEKTEIGIIEMGANHPGEIEFLCRIADPDFGIITNIGKAHLEGFGSFEGVVRTKSELYRFLEDKGGVVFINGDNPVLKTAAGDRLRLISFGANETNPLKGKTLFNPPFLTMEVNFPSGPAQIKTRLIGDYNFENVMAAIAIGLYFKIDGNMIVEAIEGYIPANNRSQLIVSGTNHIIMDAYNANPSSMKVSLTGFLQMESAQKAVILGDMLELGVETLSEHQKIVDILTKQHNCRVFLVGEKFQSTSKPPHFITFLSALELMAYLSEHPFTDTLILIKGSHGIGLEKVIGAIS